MASLPPSAVSAPASASREALLSQLATLEAAQQVWAGERQRLMLRIQDLEQQLWARKAARMDGESAAALPSLFAELAVPALDASQEARAGVKASRARLGAATPRGPQSLDPALPRERIVLPDPS